MSFYHFKKFLVRFLFFIRKQTLCHRITFTINKKKFKYLIECNIASLNGNGNSNPRVCSFQIKTNSHLINSALASLQQFFSKNNSQLNDKYFRRYFVRAERDVDLRRSLILVNFSAKLFLKQEMRLLASSISIPIPENQINLRTSKRRLLQKWTGRFNQTSILSIL